MHPDDEAIGQILSRRETLALLGLAAGAVVGARLGRWPTAARAQGACVVRPEQTEGPYFVDERLNRSDIRTDPSDGAVSAGTKLALAFAISRLEGSSCVPLQNAVVDVWHCDAAGVYSDVSDPGFDTRGKKFLRGYQLTDAGGAARFVTIWPGWYQGRTVHVHFKIRLDPDAASGYDFTSQLYFDDTLTDGVHAEQPYAAKGQRTLRNEDDGIFQNGGDQLLLTPAAAGADGYATTVEIALDLAGTPSTTTPLPSGTTTTTLAGPCLAIAACLANLTATLPDPDTATTARAGRAARRLRHRLAHLAAILDRAARSGAAKQARLHRRARKILNRMRALSEKADAKGKLEASLPGIQSAVAALLGQLPA